MNALKSLCHTLIVALLATGLLQAQEPPLKDVKGMKCPVDATVGCEGGYCSNKVKRNISVEYEGRKVYFCCEGCVKEFKKEPRKFAVKIAEQWKVIDAKNKDSEE